MAGALAIMALASLVGLEWVAEDELITLGIPVVIAAAALVNAVKAWRLFRIRHWAASKPGLAKSLDAIAANPGRMHGIATEQRALRRLRVPAGWEVHPNVAMGHGDIDLVLVSPDRTAFAVEIKSWEGLRRKRTLLGFGGAVLVKRNGHEPDTDPIAQTLREARALAATGKYPRVVPILWVPNGSFWTFRHEGVKVVNGGAWRLRRAVGAGWW